MFIYLTLGYLNNTPNEHVMLVNRSGLPVVTCCGGDSFVMALLAQSEIACTFCIKQPLYKQNSIKDLIKEEGKILFI